jgi:hypothetical protein
MYGDIRVVSVLILHSIDGLKNRNHRKRALSETTICGRSQNMIKMEIATLQIIGGLLGEASYAMGHLETLIQLTTVQAVLGNMMKHPMSTIYTYSLLSSQI